MTYVYLMKGLARIKKKSIDKEIMSMWFLLLFNMYNIKKVKYNILLKIVITSLSTALFHEDVG